MVQPPLSGINGHFVNTDNSHLAYFGSTDTSRSFGLSGATDNSLAANASRIRGGSFLKKRRMTKRRKCMTKGGRSMTKRRKTKRRKTKRRNYKGGSCTSCNTPYNPYANIQNGGLHSVTNCNNGYSTGGVLQADNLGLANPVPYQPHSNFVNPHYPNQQLSF
jgi:hypothetical protein